MGSTLPNGLKMTFLVHFEVALVFGLGYLLLPGQVGSIYGLRAEPPINDISRLLGAAMLGWALSSWMAFRALDRETVRIVVAAETVWTALGALVTLYSLLFNGFPALGWLNFLLFAAFSLVFAWYNFRK